MLGIPTATVHVRKLRGTTQPHLLRADDGHLYAVKFGNNSQNRRILVNSLIASAILHYLRIPTPESVIIRITEDFIRANSEVNLQLGMEISVLPGYHYGSRYPADTEDIAIYDLFPDALLNRVVHAGDFLGVYVVDRWLGNSAAPQAIFFRTPPAEMTKMSGFIMQSIGHSGAFDRERWQFPDSHSLKMDFQPPIYQSVTSIDSFQPWLDEVTHFPECVIENVTAHLPESWLGIDDFIELKAVLGNLFKRRSKVSDLIHASSRHPLNPFPNWQHNHDRFNLVTN